MNKTAVAQPAKATSFSPSAHGILQCKCACGTHTMDGGQCADCAKKKTGLQRKLAIGASHDPLEQEADRVADQVLAASAHLNVSSEPPRIQRAAVGSIDMLAGAEAKVAAVQGGRPPTPLERAFFEPRFGFDFTQVRIHTGPAADLAARSVGALAYTRGCDIVFREGSYIPDTDSGKRLLAHELTHVVQQGAAGLALGGMIQTSVAGRQIQRAVDEDGKEVGGETNTPPASLPDITPEEAERIGREALATIGYHEILRRALGAGILKASGVPEGQERIQRTPEPGIIQRQDFGTVFSRYAVAAGIASQVDSPAPGPGDVVAIGILIVGLFAAVAATTSTARVCPPCPTPPSSEIDRVPPSRPHFPCPGDHWHYYEYNQNPVTCQCFGPRRLFGGCCFGIPGAPC